VDDSLACKDRHEEQVRAIASLMERNLLQAGRVGSVYRRNAIFYFLVGILFAGSGLFQVRWMGWQGIFFLVIGFFLVVCCYYKLPGKQEIQVGYSATIPAPLRK
jgi:hypothetical protein